MKDRRWTFLLVCLVLAGALCGCTAIQGLLGGEKEASAALSQEARDPEYPVDAGGVRIEQRPQRVVSLAPALTEKLFDLGVDDRLAGVSDYCDYPGSASQLPACGTAQMPDIDAIALLDADLVIAEAALPEAAAAELKTLGASVAVFPRARSVEELISNYRDLARLMDGATTGGAIGAALESDFRARLDELSGALAPYVQEHGRKKALYLRLLDFTVATGDTFENELFSLACIDNIAAAQTDWAYPEAAANSPEGKAAFESADAIFMDEGFVTIQMLEQDAFYKGLPATKEDRYFYVNSLLLERQSVRTLEELARMAAYLYPDAGLSDGASGEDSGSATEESGGVSAEESEAPGSAESAG